MLVNRALVPVGERNYLVNKTEIAGLGNILVDRGEEPERVVRPVGRMSRLLDIRGVVRSIFMTCVVSEFHERKAAAVVHLRREHKADLFHRHFRRQVYDSLDILHGVPVAVSVPQATVDKGRRSRPDKGHKAVVSVPGIDHRIEFRTGRRDLKVGEVPVPEAEKLFHVLLGRKGDVRVIGKELLRLFFVFHSEEEGECSALSGSQCDLSH